MKKGKNNDKRDLTLHDLAIQMRDGFEAVDKKIEKEIERLAMTTLGEFGHVRDEMLSMKNGFNTRMDSLSGRIDDLTLNRVTWEGLKVVQARVERIEKKLHISLK